MSDQQRLLLAAVLMSLVLVAGWFLGPRGGRTGGATVPEAPPADSVETADVAGDVAEAPADSAAAEDAGPEEPSSEDVPEMSITVIIPDEDGEELVHAVISTAGGSITGWSLSRWPDLSEENAGPVNLALVPWLTTLDDSGSPVMYSYDGPSTITVDSPTRLTLSGPGGVDKTFSFSPGSYSFLAAGCGSYSLSEGALPVTEEDADPSRYFRAAWFAEKSHSEKSGSLEEERALGRVRWVAARSRYFAVILMGAGDDRVDGYAFASDGDSSPAVWMVADSARVYAGPVEYGRLRDLGGGTDSMVDFGWPFIRWIGRLIYLFVADVLSFIGNWGVRIVILSVVMKALLWPLSYHSTRSMKSMQRVQPLMQELQKKYASDPARLRQEMGRLYKEHGVNPLGGCLPLLLQMPMFFALYRVLESAVEMRGAPFVLWIADLSRPEILLPFGTKILGMSGIGLLPLLMGAAMFYQQRLTMTDPSQKGMAYLMPVVFVWLFMRFPAGLTLYWFVNNILSIIEQKIVRRGEPAPGGLRGS